MKSGSDPPPKIDVSRTIDDLERCLRNCPKQSVAAINALSILYRWKLDESLTAECCTRAGQLVREFS